MTASPLTYNVPANLATPFDANKLNATQPVSGQMANGWLDNTDIVKADSGQNYLHNSHTALLWVMQQLGLSLPFNPDGTGKSLVSTPKGGIVSIKDNATGVTQFYVAQNAMATGYVDPSTDPTNWTYINFPTLAKFVPQYADATGTSDVITASYVVVYPVLQDGMALFLGITTPNTTAAPSFTPTINGSVQTTRTIFKMVNNVATALAPGDMQGTAILIYDLPNLRWILNNPATATITLTSDPTVSDNSLNSVSSNWTKSGSVFNLATSGYVKLPLWLGGLIIQWGQSNITGTGTVTFPIAFPNAAFSVCTSVFSSTGGFTSNPSSLSLSQFVITNYVVASGAVYGGIASNPWIAIGR